MFYFVFYLYDKHLLNLVLNIIFSARKKILLQITLKTYLELVQAPMSSQKLIFLHQLLRFGEQLNLHSSVEYQLMYFSINFVPFKIIPFLLQLIRTNTFLVRRERIMKVKLLQLFLKGKLTHWNKICQLTLHTSHPRRNF